MISLPRGFLEIESALLLLVVLDFSEGERGGRVGFLGSSMR